MKMYLEIEIKDNLYGIEIKKGFFFSKVVCVTDFTNNKYTTEDIKVNYISTVVSDLKDMFYSIERHLPKKIFFLWADKIRPLFVHKRK